MNQFFADKANDKKYLAELKKRAQGEGVTTLLIMIDREGDLGNPDEAARTKAVENHYKWIEAAKFLGCHSIRVNAKSKGSFDEQKKLAADGLRRLSPICRKTRTERAGGKSRRSVIQRQVAGRRDEGSRLGQLRHTAGLR